MKTADLFLNFPITTMTIAGLLLSFSVAANAEAPSPEAFNKSSELVLTLSDHWLQPDKQTPFKMQSNGDTNNIIAGRQPKKPVNVDCGVDVNQYTSIDNSLSSRLTGECDLHYRY